MQSRLRKVQETLETFAPWVQKTFCIGTGTLGTVLLGTRRRTGTAGKVNFSGTKTETAPFFTQKLRFGVFREGVFQKMPALEGQFLKEISVRFAGENHLRTQKNTKQSSAQRFLNDPFPKTPFFSC